MPMRQRSKVQRLPRWRTGAPVLFTERWEEIQPGLKLYSFYGFSPTATLYLVNYIDYPAEVGTSDFIKAEGDQLLKDFKADSVALDMTVPVGGYPERALIARTEDGHILQGEILIVKSKVYYIK